MAITIRVIRDGFGPRLLKKTMVGFAEGYERLSWPPRVKNPGALARESVPVALAAALNSISFEDAIRKAFSRIPDEILYEIRDRLPSDLMNVVDAFYYNWVEPDIAYPGTLRKGGESVSGIKEAPPSDFIYRRGFAFGIIGGKRKGRL